MKPRHRVLVVAPVALLTLSSLASCADDDSDVAPPTTVAGASSSTDAPADTAPSLPPYESPIGDVIGEALTAGQFFTLAGLLVDAGLVQALRADGPFTVFAPNDDAFATVPAATMDAVFADRDLMTAVLTYHVVPGSFTAADLTDGQELETLQGQKLVVGKSGDSMTINGIEVLAADVPAGNGVIHVIGGVLVPQG